MLPLPLVTLLVLTLTALTTADPLHIPLSRRSHRRPFDYKAAADFIRYRYGYPTTPTPKPNLQRRGSSLSLPFTNQDGDSSYFGTVNIGTPNQTFNVILDTGSSDLWVAASNCQSCGKTGLFQSSQSTTFVQTSKQDIPISYGSGRVAGTVSLDTVSMGNFSIQQQGFLLVDQTSSGLLVGSVSGIMGLAFGAISSTGAVPFWQNLGSTKQLATLEMAFWLTRFRGNQRASEEEPGGSFTLGGTNSTLFQGDIEFIDLKGPGPLSFWLLSVSEVTVQGKSVKVATGNAALAAIDTGTTLIGGPTADVAAVWAAVTGSKPIQEMPGYYEFPCSTQVRISMAFGGKLWPINPNDMNLGPGTTENMCVGGIFDLTMGSNIEPNSGNPSWVVGDTFLKNVYSVYRSNPPSSGSVGFAQLSNLAGSSGAPQAGVKLSGALSTATVSVLGLFLSVWIALGQLLL